eukprot:TRINITY_DN2312_c0_g2_i3.p1 TRINITY_DN2312_c0_g2~~TRINITY_DN2312_c0_g2_i3.p1  ORF type:complete len:390 (+),score=60.10 TRINITY_DN2312_c0_g2_i3:251-1420(+)
MQLQDLGSGLSASSVHAAGGVIHRPQDRAPRSPRPLSSRPGRAPSYSMLHHPIGLSTAGNVAGAGGSCSSSAAGFGAGAGSGLSFSGGHIAPGAKVFSSVVGGGSLDEVGGVAGRLSLLEHIQNVQREISRLQLERKKQLLSQEVSSPVSLLDPRSPTPTVVARQVSVERERPLVKSGLATSHASAASFGGERWRRPSARREAAASAAVLPVTALTVTPTSVVGVDGDDRDCNADSCSGAAVVQTPAAAVPTTASSAREQVPSSPRLATALRAAARQSQQPTHLSLRGGGASGASTSGVLAASAVGGAAAEPRSLAPRSAALGATSPTRRVAASSSAAAATETQQQQQSTQQAENSASDATTVGDAKGEESDPVALQKPAFLPVYPVVC